MELRGVPRDSIARLLPSLDTLYARSGLRPSYIYNLWNVIANNGDSATTHRWTVREARAGKYFGNQFGRGRPAFSDPEVRDSAEAYAREALGVRTGFDSRYELLERTRAYSTLASVALARGEYRRALSLTDSARVSPCVWAGRDSRALALIALGDSAAAAPYLAVFVKGGLFLSPDSARRMTGSRVTPERWQQIVDSVEAARQLCARGGK